MVNNLQIITDVFDPLQPKTYWKWKDTNQFLEDGVTANPNFGLYVDATLAKVVLEWIRTKYSATNPSLSEIQMNVIPFEDYNGYQVVVEEGDSTYEVMQEGVQWMAHTIMRVKCYVKWASLGETFFNLENMLTEIQSIWMNYSPHKINGLGIMIPLTKLTQQGAPLDENVNQTQSSNYVKTLEFLADYQIARTTTLPTVANTYTQQNTAGDYATN